jgi:hypothetical protein
VAAETSLIVPPVVVAEGWDVVFHRSEEDVLAYYEPWFPSGAEYRSFDSEGRRLELVADPPVRRRRLLGPIGVDDAHKSTLLLRAVETEPSGESELVALLREWLPMVDVPRDGLADLTLDELLRKAIDRAGFSR